ncbi:HesA/MoeB/ThiF family protein [Muriicola sp. Z0-33]|uniref:HesA/MoeB/ThiF family protein n=1 Tax=Muriicola sp. Z0-33 TaxID=2816957 RepID=UPI0022381740|nr:HesA/MoeB/ThiF family protein [Muriicola sp. Z0-33]MCW5515217.1 HesA/MoeB/ThiF family protein [Muriicola sp. Z0-33]
MNSKRYIRQTILKEFGPEAQKKLVKARVLVVGAGGLGLPVLQYLNAMGVGTLGIVEQDIVDISNLQRQVLFDENDVGRAKLAACLEKLEAQNTDTLLIGHDTFLVRDNALKIISDYDIVIDATDNFPTRYLINDACVILNKPFVYGALHGFEAQISVFNYKGGPTYRCLYPTVPSEDEIPNCSEHGVLGVVPGIVGNLQALEAIKIISDIGEVLTGVLLLYNGLNNSFIKVNFPLVPENLNIGVLQENYETPSCHFGLQISAEEFGELLASKENLQIIDVRTIEEYNLQHVEDARNIPLIELKNRLSEINHNAEVYLLCQSGKRSQTAQLLLQEALPNCITYNVIGGMDQYSHIYS